MLFFSTDMNILMPTFASVYCKTSPEIKYKVHTLFRNTGRELVLLFVRWAFSGLEFKFGPTEQSKCNLVISSSIRLFESNQNLKYQIRAHCS